MSTSQPPRSGRPTTKQLRLLRELALERGHSFTSPTTKTQASAEIRRLQGIRRQTHRERTIERRQLDGVTGPRDASRIEAREISGFGSSARWTHKPEEHS